MSRISGKSMFKFFNIEDVRGIWTCTFPPFIEFQYFAEQNKPIEFQERFEPEFKIQYITTSLQYIIRGGTIYIEMKIEICVFWYLIFIRVIYFRLRMNIANSYIIYKYICFY